MTVNSRFDHFCQHLSKFLVVINDFIQIIQIVYDDGKQLEFSSNFQIQ